MNKVIAISGIAGSGKSTLVKLLSQKMEAVSLHFDDYAPLMVDKTTDQITWIHNIDFNNWVTNEFVEDLNNLKNNDSIFHPILKKTIHPTPSILVEEPTGRLRDEMKSIMDYHIHISVPLEIALQRWTKNALSKNMSVDAKLKRIANYIDSYHFYREVYKYAERKHSEGADLVVDGTKSPKELVEIISNNKLI